MSQIPPMEFCTAKILLPSLFFEELPKTKNNIRTQLLIEHSFKNMGPISHHGDQFHWINIKSVLEIHIRA